MKNILIHVLSLAEKTEIFSQKARFQQFFRIQQGIFEAIICDLFDVVRISTRINWRSTNFSTFQNYQSIVTAFLNSLFLAIFVRVFLGNVIARVLKTLPKTMQIFQTLHLSREIMIQEVQID